MENETMGIYPIIFDGVTSGEISVMREGLFWIFDAKCLMQNDIVRLSVFGDGQEGYLGVMEPCGDILMLKKRLSRTAMRDFPQIITHAGRKDDSEYQVIEANENSEIYDNPPDNSTSPHPVNNVNIDVDYSPPEENKPPPARQHPPLFDLSGLNWLPCPCPCSLFSGIKEKMLCSYISGAFSAHYENNLFLAIPEIIVKEISFTDSFFPINKIKLFDENYQVFIINKVNSISEL